MNNFKLLSTVALAGLALGGCATVRETVLEAIAGTHRATLSGSMVVGTAADGNGYATAELTVADALDQICYDINDLRDVGAVTAVTIRRAAMGSTGPAVLTLRTSGEGDYKNCVNRSEWLENDFDNDPSMYYVQVDTTTGAIRGQFMR